MMHLFSIVLFTSGEDVGGVRTPPSAEAAHARGPRRNANALDLVKTFHQTDPPVRSPPIAARHPPCYPLIAAHTRRCGGPGGSVLVAACRAVLFDGWPWG